MAAEICLSQLPTLVEDPNAEFQVSIESSIHICLSQLFFVLCIGWILKKPACNHI